MLADPTRLSIVVACIDHEHAAGDIAADLGLSASLVSHHLRLLRAAKVVRAERRGKHVFYSLADACVRDVLTTMSEHVFSHDHSDLEQHKRGDS